MHSLAIRGLPCFAGSGEYLTRNSLTCRVIMTESAASVACADYFV
jgi:hypothetical protein